MNERSFGESSADCNVHKPDPLAFREARQCFADIPPYEIVMVGDSSHDMEARKLGWQTFLVEPGNVEHWPKDLLRFIGES